MKQSRAGIFLATAIFTVCVALAPGHALGQATNAPAASVAAPKEASLSWVRDAGKAYVLQAVQAPPAAGSDKDKADLQAVLTAQGTRTDAQIVEAKADAEFKIELLATVIGPDFTAKNYPITFDFLKRAQSEANILNTMIQAKYPRHRPYQDHPEVKNLYEADSPAYPSTQAVDSRVITVILGQLFVEKTAAILSRDLEITQSSVGAGVSYPSDVIGGRALAVALIFVLQDNPLFIHDMARAKAEIKSKSTSQKGKG